MLRLLIVSTFFLNINAYSQTDSYLKDKYSPESVEDIVKLLNLKNAKKITIFSQDKDRSIFLGEIFLYKNGKCREKRSFHGNNMYHKYDGNGNLTKSQVFYSDSIGFRHFKYRYNKEDIIKVIRKNKHGRITERITDTLDVLSYSIPVYPQIARYNGNSNNHTYNSEGYLIKYFNKGFYLPSSKSREEEEYKGNELEYRYEYNSQNQIIKYYKRLKKKSSNCEVTTEFNYLNANIIEVKTNHSDCRCIICYNNLLYKVEYY